MYIVPAATSQKINTISKTEFRVASYCHMLLSREVRTKITWKRYFLSRRVASRLVGTDLIIESAIRESGEKRSSLEMIRNSLFAWRSRLFLFLFFLIFNRQSSSVSKCKNVHYCLNKTD